ncbi:hypothetical protein DL89DRAFT_294132 [Linderina pennispora]|uniref:Uncharacterized protein n=1 Tax=Linderina pennispora TaxID=61395 RepID=A0A1Y1W3W6_9FUNG|nr:uncharacterized protein DL89DRAFT_294132 [Linderina pennispora]ORX68211.1 hypothetical protein DL89DRAFT_294132 [Linderina pennispora]
MSLYGTMDRSFYPTSSSTGYPTYCTCGGCMPNYISQRTVTRVMYGALQAMHDLRREAERLSPGQIIDDPGLLCSYPYNWIPPHSTEPTTEALLGAASILCVIYLILNEGGVPNPESIRSVCNKETVRLPGTHEYVRCGGSVIYVLQELTQQVESDLAGEALYVDPDDLIEALAGIPPCATDDDLDNWRRQLNID